MRNLLMFTIILSGWLMMMEGAGLGSSRSLIMMDRLFVGIA